MLEFCKVNLLYRDSAFVCLSSQSHGFDIKYIMQMEWERHGGRCVDRFMKEIGTFHAV